MCLPWGRTRTRALRLFELLTDRQTEPILVIWWADVRGRPAPHCVAWAGLCEAAGMHVQRVLLRRQWGTRRACSLRLATSASAWFCRLLRHRTGSGGTDGWRTAGAGSSGPHRVSASSGFIHPTRRNGQGVLHQMPCKAATGSYPPA